MCIQFMIHPYCMLHAFDADDMGQVPQVEQAGRSDASPMISCTSC